MSHIKSLCKLVDDYGHIQDCEEMLSKDEMSDKTMSQVNKAIQKQRKKLHRLIEAKKLIQYARELL